MNSGRLLTYHRDSLRLSLEQLAKAKPHQRVDRAHVALLRRLADELDQHLAREANEEPEQL